MNYIENLTPSLDIIPGLNETAVSNNWSYDGSGMTYDAAGQFYDGGFNQTDQAPSFNQVFDSIDAVVPYFYASKEKETP